MTPDHYLLRMLYSLGVPMEDLGVGNAPGNRDSRAIFRIFARHWDAFLGTPTRMWMEHTLYEVIGVDRELRPTLPILYMIRSPSGCPIPRTGPARCSTGSGSRFWRRRTPPCADLAHHDQIAASGWPGRVIPTFRPDDLINPARPGQAEAMRRLAEITGRYRTFDGYLEAIRDPPRRLPRTRRDRDRP
jgi:glucuronate isomerase